MAVWIFWSTTLVHRKARDRNENRERASRGWDQTMAVNARGASLMSRAAVPEMRKANWSRIALRLVQGRVSGRDRAAATYAASKAAIVGFTKSLALDLAPARDHGERGSARPHSDHARDQHEPAGEYGDDLERGFAERSKAIPVGRFGTTG